MPRLDVTIAQEAAAVGSLRRTMRRRLEEKGRDALGSRHEILGVVAEEWGELLDAVRHPALSGVRHELMDLAVACVFGVACIDAELVDW